MPRMNKLSSYCTTVANDGKHMVVTYHSTAIVKWNEDEIIFNSGKWRTVTTARKIRQTANQFGLPYSLLIKNGEWKIDYCGKIIPFEDGMIISRKLTEPCEVY